MAPSSPPSETSSMTCDSHSIRDPSLPSTFQDTRPLPRALIFDLDYTLWPFWVDTHATPPLKPTKAGTSVRDALGDDFAFYPGVPDILAAARRKGLLVAAASRTCAPDLAREMLRRLRVPIEEVRKGEVAVPIAASTDKSLRIGQKKQKDDTFRDAQQTRPALALFDAMEIYPSNKVKHMTALRKRLGVEYEDMLFFDDESRNANVEAELGVAFQLVRTGVTAAEVDAGISKWRRRQGV